MQPPFYGLVCNMYWIESTNLNTSMANCAKISSLKLLFWSAGWVGGRLDSSENITKSVNWFWQKLRFFVNIYKSSWNQKCSLGKKQLTNVIFYRPSPVVTAGPSLIHYHSTKCYKVKPTVIHLSPTVGQLHNNIHLS